MRPPPDRGNGTGRRHALDEVASLHWAVSLMLATSQAHPALSARAIMRGEHSCHQDLIRSRNYDERRTSEVRRRRADSFVLTCPFPGSLTECGPDDYRRRKFRARRSQAHLRLHALAASRALVSAPRGWGAVAPRAGVKVRKADNDGQTTEEAGPDVGR